MLNQIGNLVMPFHYFALLIFVVSYFTNISQHSIAKCLPLELLTCFTIELNIDCQFVTWKCNTTFVWNEWTEQNKLVFLFNELILRPASLVFIAIAYIPISPFHIHCIPSTRSSWRCNFHIPDDCSMDLGALKNYIFKVPGHCCSIVYGTKGRCTNFEMQAPLKCRLVKAFERNYACL